MSIYDSLPNRPSLQRLWSAKIATNPSDFNDRVSVTIPGLDPTLRWESCRWQPRNSADLPQRDDDCLVVIDDNNEVWVVIWWPF